MKMTVTTPSDIYSKLILRAYELGLTNREYYLALAICDLELMEKGKELTKETADAIKKRIKELDQSDKKQK